MSKSKNKSISSIHKKCDKNCTKDDFICPNLLRVDDEPTKVAGLGFRVVYTLIAWILLGNNVVQGNGFFMSLILFAAPLFVDYVQFKPLDNNFRKWLKAIGMGISILWIIIGAIGLGDILNIQLVRGINYIKVSDTFVVYKSGIFKFKYLWFGMGISSFLTIADLFAYQTKFERLTTNVNATAS